MVGLGSEDIPVPPQPWPQLEQAETFVSQFAEPLAQLKSLAKQRGAVRYPTEMDFRKSSDEVQLTRNACRLLELEASYHWQRGNHAAATDCVIAIGAIAETLRHQPQSIAQLVRAALWGVAQSQLNDLVCDLQFPLAELERLQRHYEVSRWDDAYELALLGDRVAAYEVFSLPLRDSFTDRHLPGTELHQVLLRTQPRECGEALEMISDLIDAARSSPESLMATQQTINNKLKAALERGATPSNADHQHVRRRPNESIPFMMASTNYWLPARHMAQQRATVVVLAIERYRREQEQLPASLDDLVPQYLDAVPADPFDGKPVRFIKDGTGYTVYSVGTDLNDDSGAIGYAVDSQKDIGLSVPRSKK